MPRFPSQLVAPHPIPGNELTDLRLRRNWTMPYFFFVFEEVLEEAVGRGGVGVVASLIVKNIDGKGLRCTYRT